MGAARRWAVRAWGHVESLSSWLINGVARGRLVSVLVPVSCVCWCVVSFFAVAIRCRLLCPFLSSHKGGTARHGFAIGEGEPSPAVGLAIATWRRRRPAPALCSAACSPCTDVAARPPAGGGGTHRCQLHSPHRPIPDRDPVQPFSRVWNVEARVVHVGSIAGEWNIRLQEIAGHTNQHAESERFSVVWPITVPMQGTLTRLYFQRFLSFC